MLRRTSLPLALVAIAAAPAAFAGTAGDSPWSASFTIGTQLLPHGKFQSRHTSTVANLGSINPALAGRSGAVVIDSLRIDDVYSVGPGANLELGYELTSRLSTFARLSYSQLDGKTTRIGDILVTGLTSLSSVRAQFDDMKSWSLNFGGQYFLTESTLVRPYIAGYLGVDRSDEVSAHIRVDGTPVQFGRERLLPRETRFDAGVELGLSYDFSDKGALRFSVGGDYRSQRHEDSDAYQSLGISRVRVTDQSWSIPIELGLTYKF
jgi:hypothetical protein